MTCRKTSGLRTTDWAGFTNPTNLILGTIGIVVFVVGIFLREEGMGQALIVVAVGELTLLVLLPIVTEAEVGVEGLKFKKALEEKDAEFQPFVAAEKESLQRFAELMTGNPHVAAGLVKEAFARAYVHCGGTSREQLDAYVQCVLVRLVLGAGILGSLSHRPPGGSQDADAYAYSTGETERIAMSLAPLPPEDRVMILLHYYRDVEEQQIALIFDRPVEVVRSQIRAAASRVTAGSMLPKSGSL